MSLFCTFSQPQKCQFGINSEDLVAYHFIRCCSQIGDRSQLQEEQKLSVKTALLDPSTFQSIMAWKIELVA